MNSLQRRQLRRALSAATGFVPGSRVMLEGRATVGTVERVSPSGARDVLVKRRDNHRVCWPLSAVQAVPA